MYMCVCRWRWWLLGELYASEALEESQAMRMVSSNQWKHQPAWSWSTYAMVRIFWTSKVAAYNDNPCPMGSQASWSHLVDQACSDRLDTLLNLHWCVACCWPGSSNVLWRQLHLAIGLAIRASRVLRWASRHSVATAASFIWAVGNTNGRKHKFYEFQIYFHEAEGAHSFWLPRAVWKSSS